MRLIATLFLVCLATCAQAFDWIAHRGNAGGAAENTMGAVRASWAIQADAVELDIRISNDGIPYLFHDADINGVVLADLPFVQIKKLQTKVEIPTLANILNLEEPSGYYLLDLKRPSLEDINQYISVVRESPTAPQHIAFQSDNAEVLQAIQKELPDCKFFYLDRLERKAPFFLPPKPESILNKVAGTNIDGLSIKGRNFISESYIRSLKSTGLSVNVWTINDADRADFYRAIGVDGIITDHAEVFRAKEQDMVR